MEKSKQVLILVDETGRKKGHASRLECHTGKGKKHLAFVVFLKNDQGKFLIQKRRHELWDNFWDVSATSHPEHLNGRDETLEEAAEKCLERELGVSAETENVGFFDYYAEHPGNKCENEHCAVLVGMLEKEVTPNPSEVYEVKWALLGEIEKEINENGKEFTPWIKHTLKLLKGRKPELFK